MIIHGDYDHPGERIYAPLLLKQLSDALPENSVVCCDVGQHQMGGAAHAVQQPAQSHFQLRFRHHGLWFTRRRLVLKWRA